MIRSAGLWGIIRLVARWVVAEDVVVKTLSTVHLAGVRGMVTRIPLVLWVPAGDGVTKNRSVVRSATAKLSATTILSVRRAEEELTATSHSVAR